MATMNSSVLACNYAVSGGIGSLEFNSKPSSVSPAAVGYKLPVVKAAKQSVRSEGESSQQQGRRAALLCLGAALFATATSSANAGVIDEYLEKSKANKELNDQKRLATSGANFARAYTVQFGTCTFPYNFTGCQDLAKQKDNTSKLQVTKVSSSGAKVLKNKPKKKKVPFISDDIELECKGKDKFKCGSNVFWKW